MQPSLAQLVREVAQASPSRICFVDSNGHATRYLEFIQRADDLVGRILELNVMTAGNNRIAIFAKDSIDILIAYVAIIEAGGTVVATNNEFRSHEIQYVDGTINPVLWLTDEHGTSLLVESLFDNDVRARILEVSNLDFKSQFSEQRTHSESKSEGNPIDIIAFTSGTTGLPKAVAMSRGALREMIAGVVLSYRIPPFGRCLYTAKMAFVPTVLTQIFGHLCTGGTIYIPQDRSLDRVFQQIIDQNITYVYIPTPWLPGFFDLSENDSRILCSGLTAVMHAGSSVSSEVLARALTIFGSVFVEAWGMTETCGMPITAYVPDDLLVHQAQYLAETVGRNLPGMQVRVDGSISGEKSEGELLISGSSCFDGYWEDGKVIERDTWFGTGDIGVVDETGLVRLTGRLKELIISGGANVSPLEVEDCVLQCDGVIDAAVFGIDDAYWGEAVCLVIVASDPSDQTLISRIDLHCRSRLARYKVPKKILVVNDLPRTASQKLKRVEIKEKFMLEVVSQLSEHGGQV